MFTIFFCTLIKFSTLTEHIKWKLLFLECISWYYVAPWCMDRGTFRCCPRSPWTIKRTNFQWPVYLPMGKKILIWRNCSPLVEENTCYYNHCGNLLPIKFLFLSFCLLVVYPWRLFLAFCFGIELLVVGHIPGQLYPGLFPYFLFFWRIHEC